MQLYHEADLRGIVFTAPVLFLSVTQKASGYHSHTMRKRNYLKINRSSRSLRSRIALIAIAVLAVSYLLVSFIFGEMGVIKYYRMKEQYDYLTQEIATLKQDNARLLKDVHALKTDPYYLEILARDKLGLARQGEIVYYYDEP